MLVDFITKSTRCVSRCRYMSSRGGSAIARQSRAMEKLFGNRVVGSKKRHWPTDGISSINPQSNLFKGAPTARNGKSNTRRMQVLNKLFMENISQLLAEVESVLNYGLQIQRVKISPDFSMVNVYWIGSGDPLQDDRLGTELKRHSGLLRHELSQLRLMGEVPRILFVHDRSLANLTQVDSMLRNMTFEEENDDDEHINVMSKLRKEEFFGKIKPPADVATNQTDYILPEMQQDVLGLDHRDIMSRILAKMKKSKAAWDIHNQTIVVSDVTESEKGLSLLDQINIKLAEAAEAEPKFDQFLAKRRERKNTPERKKHNRSDDIGNQLNESLYDEEIVSANRKQFLQEEDYIDDEHEDVRKT